jgi:hypothetical protein
MEASEIEPNRIYHNGRGIAYGVEAIKLGRVYYRINGLKEGMLASMALEAFAKAMTEEVRKGAQQNE